MYCISPVLLFRLCLVFGVALRLWLSTLGHNDDIESYWIVSKAALAGKSVYSETNRYNYGPLWFLMLGLLRRATIALKIDDLFHFHLIIAAFLTFIDILTAVLIRRRFGASIALFFFLNPVTILITGYHSQFDNVAILLGLAACSLLANSRRNNPARFAAGNLLLGLSLAMKHVLIFFPIWLWMKYRRQSRYLGFSFLVVVIPYGLFCLSFLPYIFDQSSYDGIISNVLAYRSWHGNGLISQLLELFVNIHVVETQLDLLISKWIFTFVVILAGHFWTSEHRTRQQEDELLFLYLITLVTFSSSMADQYLAVPIIALARYGTLVMSWIYSLAATLALITSKANVFGYRFAEMRIIDYHQAQIWLLFILLVIWRRNGRRRNPLNISRSE